VIRPAQVQSLAEQHCATSRTSRRTGCDFWPRSPPAVQSRPERPSHCNERQPEVLTTSSEVRRQPTTATDAAACARARRPQQHQAPLQVGALHFLFHHVLHSTGRGHRSPTAPTGQFGTLPRHASSARVATLMGCWRNAVGASDKPCRVACGASAAIQPTIESCWIAVGQLVEQRGPSLDQMQPLIGRHGVLQGTKTGAPPPAELGIAERGAQHSRGRWTRPGPGRCRLDGHPALHVGAPRLRATGHQYPQRPW